MLAGVVENLVADLPKLVYADWLDEHGRHARAEFIRVQCELARLSADDPVRAALAIREMELLGNRDA